MFKWPHPTTCSYDYRKSWSDVGRAESTPPSHWKETIDFTGWMPVGTGGWAPCSCCCWSNGLTCWPSVARVHWRSFAAPPAVASTSMSSATVATTAATILMSLDSARVRLIFLSSSSEMDYILTGFHCGRKAHSNWRREASLMIAYGHPNIRLIQLISGEVLV